MSNRRLNRLFIFPGLTSLVFYSFGFAGEEPKISTWLKLCGAMAWIMVDMGTGFLVDYSEYRADPAADTYSRRFQNPLLALKGGWALFLIAFLFVLIGFLSLPEKGWVLPVISGFGLGARYGFIHLKSWKKLFGVIGWIALPFLSSFLISR